MFSRTLLFLLSIPILTTCQSQAPPIQIIPQPLSIKTSAGFFTLKPDTKIYLPNDEKDWATAAEYLKLSIEPATGYALEYQSIAQNTPNTADNAIFFQHDPEMTNQEAYQLDIKPNAVFIRAGSAAGAFYAVQTLRQLFPPEIYGSKLSNRETPWTAPCCTIQDAPRFAYRGLHLDVGRHYFPASFIKRYIDLLATHKLNTFHWHLTEDQGWRIEIKKYPKLQSEAACRTETLAGHYSDSPKRYDGTPYCAFYTQEEVKEIVAYAQKRFVTIIPEIEMPGHSMAALSAYPELGCTGGPYETGKTWGVFEDVYCAGNEATFEFIENVLEEVCALFPGTYVHIGGDECPKTRWDACPKCQSRIKKEGLKDAHELQSYFIHRVEAMLNKRGKKLIGWDEILEGGIAPSATIMSWRGIAGGIAAAKAGHDVIMTPGSALYFDHYQSDPTTEPLAIGGYLPLETVYNYDPVPTELNASEAKYILGAQGNVWTEYMLTSDQVEYMAYPRACALAEVVWSSTSNKNWADFGRRLHMHFARLDAMDLSYSKAFYDVSASLLNGKVSLKTSLPGLEIRYTTDGTVPTAASKRYSKPFPLHKTTTVRAVSIQNKKPAGTVHTVPYVVHKASGKPYSMPRSPDKYKGGEQYGLTNGMVGSVKSWENWVGLVNHDIDPVIDFGKATSFNRVTIHYVNAKMSWIYPPLEVSVFVSDDGQNFKRLVSKIIDAEGQIGSSVETVLLNTPGAKGRYLKFVAKTFGVIPNGAPGAGEGAWLFVDEVVVE